MDFSEEFGVVVPSQDGDGIDVSLQEKWASQAMESVTNKDLSNINNVLTISTKVNYQQGVDVVGQTQVGSNEDFLDLAEEENIL